MTCSTYSYSSCQFNIVCIGEVWKRSKKNSNKSGYSCISEKLFAGTIFCLLLNVKNFWFMGFFKIL